MLFADRIKSNPIAVVLTLLHIGFITLMDYISGADLSFSIFYLIPISIIAARKTSSRFLIVLISIISAICWYGVDVHSKDYTHELFPIWNAFVRLVIFITTGLLVFSFRRKHDTLNEINIKLKYLNDEKNKFIGMAAHDIRNPISGIYSFSDLLLSDDTSKMNEEEIEIIHYIKSLSETILDLIKNLLDISKIESGHIDINYKQLDYVVFIKKQMRINQLLANKKQISINLNLQQDQIISEFDEDLMSQVINNLLSNAIKYSEKNSHITINITESDGNILTEVIDNGKGIPFDEQKILFNYFQKTSTKPTDGETSTGLGLAIVKKIITAFNGTIGVNSNVNEGSNFYFSFPIKSQ